jgi:hypothetical protein
VGRANGLGTKTVATFTLIVEYDEMPDTAELRRLVEEARSYGGPIKAELNIYAPKTINLL